jgi:hypothetical protein
MIAYDHKHTHVITPAGTIMTATIVVSVVLDYVLAEALVLFVKDITNKDAWFRVPVIVFLICSLTVLKPAVDQERRRDQPLIEDFDTVLVQSFIQVDEVSNTDTSFMSNNRDLNLTQRNRSFADTID